MCLSVCFALASLVSLFTIQGDSTSPVTLCAPGDVLVFPAAGPNNQPREERSPFGSPGASGGWIGQSPVFEAAQGEVLWEPSINFDSQQAPWVFWLSKENGRRGVLRFTWWGGEAWLPKQAVDPDDYSYNLRLRSVIADNDSIWLVWHRAIGNSRDVFYSRGDGVSWSSPQLVNAPNNRLDFAPKIGAGGGQIWVTWYGEEGAITDDNPPHVYVTRWNGVGWEPERELSAGISGYHWFSNIAVAPDGIAHVVWGDSDARLIYYTHSEPNGDWTQPVAINPLEQGVAAAGWPATSIVLDSAGGIHVAWVGRRIGRLNQLEDWDIFYSYNDGEQWTPPVQVNPDNETTDAYPDLVAYSPDDVWIAWYDGDPASTSSEPHVKVVRWNGSELTGIWRLDDDQYPIDGVPDIASDPEGLPWVVWDTIEAGYVSGGISYSRYDATIPVLLTNLRITGGEDAAEISWWAEPRHFDRFFVERLDGVSFVQVQSIVDDGRGAYSLFDYPPKAGSWTYRIQAVDRDGLTQSLGPATVRVGSIPARLAIQLPSSPEGSGPIHVMLGLPESGIVAFVLLDVAGRQIASWRPDYLQAGWSSVDLDLNSAAGARLARGVYLLSARAGRQQAAAKVVLAR